MFQHRFSEIGSVRKWVLIHSNIIKKHACKGCMEQFFLPILGLQGVVVLERYFLVTITNYFQMLCIKGSHT